MIIIPAAVLLKWYLVWIVESTTEIKPIQAETERERERERQRQRQREKERERERLYIHYKIGTANRSLCYTNRQIGYWTPFYIHNCTITGTLFIHTCTINNIITGVCANKQSDGLQLCGFSAPDNIYIYIYSAGMSKMYNYHKTILILMCYHSYRNQKVGIWLVEESGFMSY